MGKPLHSDLRVQLYAITDRTFFSSQKALLDCAASWARGGVDYLQIREKDLGPDELSSLVLEIVGIVRRSGSSIRVLLNGPIEIAIASGCDGVHLSSCLPADAIDQARKGLVSSVISVSCHTVSEVKRARDHGATLALFAPVFEKRVGVEKASGQGLPALAEACRVAAPMPVFALGGVTAQNAADCVKAGAAGIAAIRLFASSEWRQFNASFRP